MKYFVVFIVLALIAIQALGTSTSLLNSNILHSLHSLGDALSLPQLHPVPEPKQIELLAGVIALYAETDGVDY